MAIEIKAPEPWARGKFTIFLAGAIDQNKAEDWQSQIVEALADFDVLLLNPRRDDWDSSWEQSASDPQFREQVIWEQRGLDEADFRTFVLLDESNAPITLLELGEHIDEPGAVCCEPEYYRKGNVDISATLNKMPVFESLDGLIGHLTTILEAEGLRTGTKKIASAAGCDWSNPKAGSLCLGDLDKEYPDFTTLIFQFVSDGTPQFTGMTGNEEVAWEKQVPVKLMDTKRALKDIEAWGMSGDDGDERGEPHIVALMESMRQGVPLPPAVTDHTDSIIDGRHRIHAVSRLGVEQIPYISITDTVAKEEGIAQNGITQNSVTAAVAVPTQPVIETPAFKTWFADSKVVDAKGNPLVVYHGTDEDFDVFHADSHFGDARAARSRLLQRKQWKGKGKDVGKGKQLWNARTMPCYLRITNPFELTDREANDNAVLNQAVKEGKYPELSGDAWGPMESSREAMKRLGYDGIVYSNVGEGGLSYIIFSPYQVKSAIGNNGKFDPESNSITASAVAEPPTQSATETPAFRSWFGQSKVVDAEGNPRVVHHKTHNDFDEFDRLWAAKRFGRDPEGTDTVGLWFTENPEVQYGPKNMDVYLSIKKPLELWDEPGKGCLDQLMEMVAYEGGATKLRNELKSYGYDGIKFEDTDLDWSKQTVWIALEPNQVKSADRNDGQFDPKSNSILASRPKFAAPEDIEQLKATLDLTDAQKGEELARAVTGYFKEWIEENYPDLEEHFDEEGFVNDEDYAVFPPEALEEFVEPGTSYIMQHDPAYAPSFTHMSYEGDVANEWLIHFTDDPVKVADDGFTVGMSDANKLGLTTYYKNEGFDKKYGGYNFAYTLSDYKRYHTREKYGHSCVIFRAPGIKVYHYGDQEPQVIFWGKDATDIVPISSKAGDDDWAVLNKASGYPIHQGNDLDEEIDWAVNHLPLVFGPDNTQRIEELQQELADVREELLGQEGSPARAHTRWMKYDASGKPISQRSDDGTDLSGQGWTREEIPVDQDSKDRDEEIQRLREEAQQLEAELRKLKGEPEPMQKAASFLSPAEAKDERLSAFIHDLWAHTTPNPDNDKEVIWKDAVGIEARSFWQRIHIGAIRSLDEGQGHASAALEFLKGLADKHQVELEVVPVPFGDRRLNQAQLREWYVRHGFKKEPDGYVYRPLQVEKTAATTPVTPTPPGFQPWYTDTPRGEYDPDFKPVDRPATSTPELHTWFGESKVVDAKGNPLAVYHATSHEGKTFANRNKGYGQFGHWFDASPGLVESYTLGDQKEHQPNVIPVYLSIKNPKVFPDTETFKDAVNGKFGPNVPSRAQKLRTDLKKQGFDGALIHNSANSDSGRPDFWVAFDQKQIKSAIGNNGDFDPKNKRIVSRLLMPKVTSGWLPPQLQNVRAKQASAKCTCGHTWDEHVHMADFGCKHEGEGCGCLGWTDKKEKRGKLASATPEQMIREAHGYADQFGEGHVARVAPESLSWIDEPAFDLHKIDKFDVWGSNWKWLVRDLWDRAREGRSPDAAKEYYENFKQAVSDHTIDPILVVQGIDGKFYIWDGHHRVAMAFVLGVTTMPAWVGYQPETGKATAQPLTKEVVRNEQ